MPDSHEHDHEHPHEHPHDDEAEALREANIEELRKAVKHLTVRNVSRETLLAEIEHTRPNPIEVQAARLELIIAQLVPDELQRLWLEYHWQQAYAGILTDIEASSRPNLNGSAVSNGNRGD